MGTIAAKMTGTRSGIGAPELDAAGSSDESITAGAQAVFDDAHGTVRDEDYRLAEALQANLASGARDHLLFGRNEPGLQHRHIAWDDALHRLRSGHAGSHR